MPTSSSIACSRARTFFMKPASPTLIHSSISRISGCTAVARANASRAFIPAE